MEDKRESCFQKVQKRPFSSRDRKSVIRKSYDHRNQLVNCKSNVSQYLTGCCSPSELKIEPASIQESSVEVMLKHSRLLDLLNTEARSLSSKGDIPKSFVCHVNFCREPIFFKTFTTASLSDVKSPGMGVTRLVGYRQHSGFVFMR